MPSSKGDVIFDQRHNAEGRLRERSNQTALQVSHLVSSKIN